ncbi:MAG TPA: hypothetical protein VK112_10775 [Fodinibius sp.]|nr:hypothetical protein [Fodinibius sp.]
MLSKTNILTIILAGAIICCGQAATAQNISIGGGVGYGNKSNNLNFYVNGNYAIPQSPIRIGTVLGYSLREKNSTRRVDRIRADLNTYLMAVDKEVISLYGLVGLNVSRYRTKYKTGRDAPYTDINVYAGANAGAGLELDAGVGRYFAEGKYIFGHDAIAGFVVRTGLRVGI